MNATYWGNLYWIRNCQKSWTGIVLKLRILSHGAPSSLNMSSNRAIWTDCRSNSMIWEQIEFLKIICLNFQISGRLVLSIGKAFFPKVVRLKKWCRTVKTKYSGAELSKHILFHLKDLWVLGPWSWVHFFREKIGACLLRKAGYIFAANTWHFPIKH